jgi:hypothetical protein
MVPTRLFISCIDCGFEFGVRRRTPRLPLCDKCRDLRAVASAARTRKTENWSAV